MTLDGLTGLPTAALEDLMRLIYRGHLECPFDRKTLMSMGLNAVAAEGELLLGLDERAVRAVIAAVIAERRPRR